MANLGIDGLVSGLDTTSLINQLMQVESAPQTLLKSKQTTTKSLVTALQSLNTKVASLAEAATKAAKPESWRAFTATSSSAGVTATAATGAQVGSLSFTVDKVATTQVTLSAPVLDGATLVAAVPPAVTIRKADGTLVSVSPATGSLADVTAAINATGQTGVTATAVRVGPDTHRLQLTATATGTAGAFEVFAGTAAEVTAGTATRIDTASVRTAEDAQVTLWEGSAFAKQVVQSSNTFTGLMTGVDVTVSKVTGVDEEPATVTVALDTSAQKSLAAGLVGAIGVVMSEISSRTAVTTTTASDGSTSVSGGLFTGDSVVRSVQQNLIQAASYPVDGVSPSTVGIKLGKDGSFTFDDKVFASALAADPAQVQSVIAGIAARVADVATSVSDKFEGTLTLKIQGQQKLVTTMGTQIEDWDRRLAVRRENLQRTYSALEVTLSNLQSQSSWLAGQLGALTSSGQ